MTQSAARPLLTWEDGPHASFRGTAGGIELFSIHMSSRRTGPRWLLRCELPGLTYIPPERGASDDKNKLKDRAESMLAGWLGRVGAVTSVSARQAPASAHEIIPLPGSVQDHGDVFITTRGTCPEQYPLTAVCGECQDGAYCADITADWCHLDDAVRHLVQAKVLAQLASVVTETGVTSVELAKLTGQPPCAVRRALALLENRGAAGYVKSGGNENMIQWFLTTGGHQ